MAKRGSSRARSAATGRFVRKSTAKRHPRMTVVDSMSGSKHGATVKIARSVVTGRFVKRATAKRHPKTTVIETVKR